MNTSPRFRRGDTSPLRPGLVFFRYSSGAERWVTPEAMCRRRVNARRIDKKWKSSPSGRKYMRDYFREYNQLPSQKEYHSNFYKQPHVRAKIRDTHHRRQKTDPQYRIAGICRSRINAALKSRRIKKGSKTEQLIGCSFEFFRGWIEKDFAPGMSWENYGSGLGQWEIDHREPIARFHLEFNEECRKAFHYSNCRPMWAIENRTKNDFIEHNGQTVRARELRKIIPFSIAA